MKRHKYEKEVTWDFDLMGRFPFPILPVMGILIYIVGLDQLVKANPQESGLMFAGMGIFIVGVIIFLIFARLNAKVVWRKVKKNE